MPVPVVPIPTFRIWVGEEKREAVVQAVQNYGRDNAVAAPGNKTENCAQNHYLDQPERQVNDSENKRS